MRGLPAILGSKRWLRPVLLSGATLLVALLAVRRAPPSAQTLE